MLSGISTAEYNIQLVLIIQFSLRADFNNIYENIECGGGGRMWMQKRMYCWWWLGSSRACHCFSPVVSSCSWHHKTVFYLFIFFVETNGTGRACVCVWGGGSVVAAMRGRIINFISHVEFKWKWFEWRFWYLLPTKLYLVESTWLNWQDFSFNPFHLGLGR